METSLKWPRWAISRKSFSRRTLSAGGRYLTFYVLGQGDFLKEVKSHQISSRRGCYLGGLRSPFFLVNFTQQDVASGAMAKLEALRGDRKERWRTSRFQGPGRLVVWLVGAGVVYLKGSLALALKNLNFETGANNNNVEQSLSVCQSNN